MSADDPKDLLIAQLQQQVEQLTQQLHTAHARIAELQVVLRRHFAPAQSPAPKSSPAPSLPSVDASVGLKRDTPGHHRALLAADQVTQVDSQLPSACQKCHGPLHGVDPQPRRHQVVEVPPLSAQVTDCRMHRLRCDHCGTWTRAELPAGVWTSCFGPRLTALVALCTGTYRMSKQA